MKHQIKAVLFDLDGVVVFTDKYHYLGWKKLADENDWDFDEEVNHACRGIPRIASLNVILDHNKIDLPEEEKEKLANLKNEYYKKLIKQISLDDIYPGIIQFLEKLKAKGVRLAICSSSKNAMTVLDALDLSKYFDAVVGGNDIENPKPNPEIFLKGAELLNMHPAHCLVFEDAESGVKAAHSAKMKCIGVGTPDRLPNAFEHITDYNEIDICAMLDAGRVKSIAEDSWRITETELKRNRFPFWETAFALSNGVIGVRGTFEESSVGYEEYPATFLNGICGYEPYQYLWKLPGYPDDRHAILNICDWINIDLKVDGETFSVAKSNFLKHKRSLNLKSGILEREFIWETNSGKKIHVKTQRFVSMVRKNIAGLRYSVTPETECELTFKSQTLTELKSKVMSINHVEVEKVVEDIDVDVIYQKIKTAADKVVLAQSYSLAGQKNIEGNILNFKSSIRAQKDKTVTLDKIFSAYSTMDSNDLHDVNSELLSRTGTSAQRCAKLSLRKVDSESLSRTGTSAQRCAKLSLRKVDSELLSRTGTSAQRCAKLSLRKVDSELLSRTGTSAQRCAKLSLRHLVINNISSAREAGFEKMRKEQEDFWAEFWKDADIKIEGNIQDQQAVRFSLFHLRQSNPEKSNRSISANGLTGDEYSGLVFWDTEMYMLPPLIYTQPETVKGLLEYRYSILDKARERAKQMHGIGALFSWNSIKGEECGHVYEASTAQYHLLPDIAFAIDLYDRMTGDEDFIFNKAAEILFEMCRFMEDRGCYVKNKKGKFCINVVCGPDEYGCGVNNNAYTNSMTKWMFEYAISLYKRFLEKHPEKLADLSEKISLTKEEISVWKKAAENMYIPEKTSEGIIPQDDCFMDMDSVDMDLIPKNTDIRHYNHPLNLWRMQVIKQADVLLLMFTLGYKFSLEQKKSNYLYYEPKTNHGSSLSPCIHSIIASEIGFNNDAYNFFRQTALMDLNDFKNNTKGGVHSACLGGCWMTVVNGFAGMRDYPDGLIFNPVLPDTWKSYSFSIVYKGNRILVEVTDSEIKYSLLEGNKLTFNSHRKKVLLSKGNNEFVQKI